MTKNSIFTLLFVFAMGFTQAQSINSLQNLKQKIENTVPVLKQFFISKATQYDEQGGISPAMATLEKQYKHVSSEYDMYLYNISGCILLKDKESQKCMNKNNRYLTKTLGVYDTYINYVTQEKGKAAEEVLSQVKFDTQELMDKVESELGTTAVALKKKKSAERSAFVAELKSGAYKMKDYNEL